MTPCSQVCARLCVYLPVHAGMHGLRMCVKVCVCVCVCVCVITPSPQSLQTHFPQQIKCVSAPTECNAKLKSPTFMCAACEPCYVQDHKQLNQKEALKNEQKEKKL